MDLYELIDKVFMPFYRFPDNALTGYYFGTLVLAFASMIIGEYSISFAFRLNKGMIDHDIRRIDRFQNLSFEALKAGDKDSFKACNGIANETYGKSFFSQITLSAASLWPLFIALGWMQYRFSGVEFHLPVSVPLSGGSIGYLATFLFCYVVVHIVVKKAKAFLYKEIRQLYQKA